MVNLIQKAASLYENSGLARGGSGSLFGNSLVDLSQSLAQGRIVKPAKAAAPTQIRSTSAPIQNYSVLNKSVPKQSGTILGRATQQAQQYSSLPQQTYDQGAPYEQAPEQNEPDWNSIFSPAFEALNAQEGALNQNYGADVAQAEAGVQSNKNSLQTSKEAKLADYQQQRETETGRTEGMVGEARRQAAELLQGIQARYGGTTHLGEAASSILGAQATKNIAGNRQALQVALSGIAKSESNLKNEVDRLVQEEDQRLEATKMKLRAELSNSLAAIASERGRLESEKAAKRIEYMREYQNVIAGINQRNTEFKQGLFLRAQEAQQKIEGLRQKATDRYQASLTPAELSQINGILSDPYADPAAQAQARAMLEQQGYSTTQKKKSPLDELPGVNQDIGGQGAYIPGTDQLNEFGL